VATGEVSEEISILVEEEGIIEVAVVTSRTCTGMRVAVAGVIQATSHLSIHLPSSNIHNIQALMMVHYSSSSPTLRMMTVKISSGHLPRISRLRTKMRLRRRTRKRCPLQVGLLLP
jgi:hypothetical protein